MSINNDFFFILVLVFMVILVDLSIENIFVCCINDGVFYIKLLRGDDFWGCENE